MSKKPYYESIKILFRAPSQIMVIFGLIVFFFFFTAALGNFSSLVEFLQNSSSYGFLLSLRLFLSLILTSFVNPLSLILTLLLSFLVSINLILFIRSKRATRFTHQPLGFLGIVSGILGIGCATCGTLLTGSLISFFGITFVSATLPFQSLFFQLTGIILLTLSITLLLKEASPSDTMCKIKQ